MNMKRSMEIEFSTVEVCIHLTHSLNVECDTSLILKQNTANLNSKFSFSKASCCIKAHEPEFPTIYFHLRSMVGPCFS